MRLNDVDYGLTFKVLDDFIPIISGTNGTWVLRYKDAEIWYFAKILKRNETRSLPDYLASSMENIIGKPTEIHEVELYYSDYVKSKYDIKISDRDYIWYGFVNPRTYLLMNRTLQENILSSVLYLKEY